MGVLKSLIDKVDGLLIAGGMAYTFFKAQGIAVGDSLLEEDLVESAKEIIEKCRRCQVELLLPVDHLVADRLNEAAVTQLCAVEEGLPQGEMGVDIGPKTVALFSEKLKEVKTLFWNGPLGLFEIASFAKGTQAIAQQIAYLDAITIVGGGDSIAALQAAGFSDRMTHISTGGGAALEYIQKGTLPAIDALTPKIVETAGDITF